jgi:hypothetical protein
LPGMKGLARGIADMSTLSPKGQALIRAAQRAYQPTAADRERLLGQLRAQLGDAALPPDMATAASAATASSSAWPLISVVVVGVGILGGALFYAWPRGAGQDKMQETKAAPVAARTQAIEPIAAPPVEPPTGTPTAMPTPDPPALPATTAYRPKDRLAAEVAILSRATRDLRAGPRDCSAKNTGRPERRRCALWGDSTRRMQSSRNFRRNLRWRCGPGSSARRDGPRAEPDTLRGLLLVA